MHWPNVAWIAFKVKKWTVKKYFSVKWNARIGFHSIDLLKSSFCFVFSIHINHDVCCHVICDTDRHDCKTRIDFISSTWNGYMRDSKVERSRRIKHEPAINLGKIAFEHTRHWRRWELLVNLYQVNCQMFNMLQMTLVIKMVDDIKAPHSVCILWSVQRCFVPFYAFLSTSEDERRKLSSE